MVEAFSITCHELANFDFRCGSKLPVHEGGQLRTVSGVMRTKIGAKPTSANKCPKLGPIQTCRGGGSNGKS